MNFRRGILVFLLAVNLVLTVTLFYFVHLARQEAAERDSDRRDAQALATAVANKQEATESLSAQLVRRERNARSGSGVAKGKAIAGAGIGKSQRKWGAIATDPELRKLYLEQFRAGLPGSYGRMFRELNLTPDQIARFTDIYAEFEDKTLDLYSVAAEKNLTFGDDALQAQHTADGHAFNQELVNLLGLDGYEIYHEYDHDMVLEPAIDAMAANTYATDTPLTDDQAQNLMRILSDASARAPTGFVRPFAVDWTTAMKQAQAVLSPTQIAVLRSVKEAMSSLAAEGYGGPAGASPESVATVSKPPPLVLPAGVGRP